MKLRNRIVAGMLLLTLATVNTISTPGSLVNVSAADGVSAKYTVVFAAEGQNYEPESVEAGTTVAEPAAPERRGYVFLGWYNGDEKYDFSQPVTGTLILTAKWEDSDELKKVKTAFENIDKEKESLKAEYFEDAESWALFEVAYQAAKDEYQKGGKADATLLDELTATLQARKSALDETRKKVTVTLQTGILQDFTSQVNMGNPVPVPITPSRTGYVFGGWYVDGLLYDFTSPAEQDIVLVATWVEDTDLAAAKASFQAVSDKINGMDANLYTPESWNELVTAYDAAKLGVETADAAVLRQLTASLETVVSNLVMKDAVPAQPGADQNTAVQPEVKVSEIEISETYTQIAAGKKLALSVDVMPEDATNKAVTWSSSNKKVATVNQNGVVKAKNVTKSKKVTITATATDGSGVVAEYEIKVMPQAVKKITLTAPTTTVAAGDKLTITATVSPVANKKLLNSKLEWVSSNLKYATVSEKGVVKTKAAGAGKTVKITATATDGSKKKATISIKID